MSTREKIFAVVKTLSATDTELSETVKFMDTGFSSLSMVELILAVEEEFDIELNDSDLAPANLVVIGDLISLVEKYI